MGSAPAPLELTCHLHPGWAPLLRPAPATRRWMDETPESFAYRCLPLNIANAHGWEVLSPCAFEASWAGGAGVDAVTIRLAEGAEPARAPVSLFGQGVLTFHIEGVFRTSPGWNLWIGGSPNQPKDGIAPLTGIVETDWSPFTFTMNWRFTRTDHRVRFEAMEPICFLFPVQRGILDAVEPKLAPMEADPALTERFAAWSQARHAFHERMSRAPPKAAADKWQKHYYRGVCVDEHPGVVDHEAKLRLRPFMPAPPPQPPGSAAGVRPHAPVRPGAADAALAAHDQAALKLRQREWLLEAIERQRSLSPAACAIPRQAGLGSEEFLERYYAPSRPVILTGEMADWPALQRWTPAYLAEMLGAVPVELQDFGACAPGLERGEGVHGKQAAPINVLLDLVTSVDAGADTHVVAHRSAANREALSPLRDELGHLKSFLSHDSDPLDGMMRISPAGTLTPLHHDLSNSLIVQVVGQTRLKLLPASEAGRLYEDKEVLRRVVNLNALDATRFPRIEGARVYDVLLNPGEIIFVPLAWWHQTSSMTFGATLTYTNFLWPNDAASSFPLK